MVYKALLLILPAFAYAQHNMSIKAKNRNMRKPLVLLTHFGSIEDVISDTERRTWNLTDESLKDVIVNCGWARPDDVYVKSPTPWGDVYKIYKHLNIQEVHRILKPLSPQFIGIRYERVPIFIEHVHNDRNITAEYSVEGKIKYAVKETLSTEWSTDGELSISKDISYEFILRKWNLPDFSFTGTFGKNAEISKRATVVSKPRMTVELKPGEVGAAALMVSRGTMEMYVEYEAYLSGNVTVNYARYKVPLYPGVNDIFNKCKSGKLRSSVNPRVKIKVVFYAKPEMAFFNNWRWTFNLVQHGYRIKKRIDF